MAQLRNEDDTVLGLFFLSWHFQKQCGQPYDPKGSHFPPVHALGLCGASGSALPQLAHCRRRHGLQSGVAKPGLRCR